MLPRTEKIDPQEGHQDKEKPDHPEHSRFSPYPSPVIPRVEICSHNKPGDERPGLFRVPGPESTPHVLRPDGATDDHYSEERKAHHGRLIGDPIENRTTGSIVHSRVAVF